MRKISKKLRDEIEADPYYKNCCLTGMPGTVIKIEWHHNLMFAGRQVNEKFAILPVDKDVHDRLKGDSNLRDRLDWIMLNRATDEELKRYSKAEDLKAKRERLNEKFGCRPAGYYYHQSKLI